MLGDMKMRILSVLLLTTWLCATLLAYAGGSGTSEDPYRIATAEDLIQLGETPEDCGQHFIVLADINLEFYPKPESKWSKKTDFLQWVLPGFSGVFDGNGHVIRNVRISGSDDTGLFEKVEDGGLIMNLGVGDVEVTGDRRVGGLAASNYGTIVRCYSTGTVSGENCVGGLVGYNKGRIRECYSSGDIEGEEHEQPFGSGSDSQPSTLGGLVGRNAGRIISCFSVAGVSGVEEVGGLAGDNPHGYITSCYSRGTVNGEMYVGGLVGNSTGHINYSYSTGKVTANDKSGGLVRPTEESAIRGHVIGCFWNTTTSGLPYSHGGAGLTRNEMKYPKFIGLQGLHRDPNWVLNAYQEYPRLAWEQTGGDPVPAPNMDWLPGKGTAAEPHYIENADQIRLISKAGGLWDKHFILGQDVDLAELSWQQAVIPDLSGFFYGNGHVIRNLALRGVSHLGFVGQLAEDSAILNLGLEGVDVNGTDGFIGAVTGYNLGLVDGCYSTGTIKGANDVGGLVGMNECFISNSYSQCTIDGREGVGCLAGETRGSISMSYGVGKTSEYPRNISLVGNSVSGDKVASSFWDKGTSWNTNSRGLPTHQMKAMQTYLTAGWDFVGERKNGTSDVWQMPAQGGYPILRVFQKPTLVTPQGLGTRKSPYLITSADALSFIRDHPFAFFKLETAIDLSGVLWQSAPIPCMNGTFDGNGYSVKHLNIEGGAYLGLMGFMGPDANVLDLEIDELDIAGGGDFIGGLAGFNAGGMIGNCCVVGTVRGDRGVGGLVGRNDGHVQGCRALGEIQGLADVGGLVGKNMGTITHCSSANNVKGEYDVGGLIGENSNGWIDMCFCDNTVIGSGSVGGLIGSSDSRGALLNSFCTSIVNGSSSVGGFVGSCGHSNMVNCYCTGMVIGLSTVGGFAGNVYDSTVVKCYAGSEVIGNRDVGGFIGKRSHSEVTYCLWDTDTSRLEDSVGGVGLTTREMMDPEWLSLNGWADDPNWTVNAGKDYPRLAWAEMPGEIIFSPGFDWIEGDGTSDDPFVLVDSGQIVKLARAAVLWDGHMLLGCDIDLKGLEWQGSVIPLLSGSLDGNGFVIKNLKVYGDNHVGLVGVIHEKGEVSHLSVVNAYIEGNKMYVGTIAGQNDGTIIDCHCIATVSGLEVIGGIAGKNNGTVTDCHCEATVSGVVRIGGVVVINNGQIIATCCQGQISGEEYVGGLIGDNRSVLSMSHSTGRVSGDSYIGGLDGGSNESDVSNCYSHATVAGQYHVGGLIGRLSNSKLFNSYSTGRVTGDERVGGLVGYIFSSNIRFCFWDRQTSGRGSGYTKYWASPGTIVEVRSKTTLQMQAKETFLQAGWDFVDEIENGTDDIWMICAGKDYPRLQWEQRNCPMN